MLALLDVQGELAAFPRAGCSSLLLLVDDNMYYRRGTHPILIFLLPEQRGPAQSGAKKLRRVLPCRSMRYEMAQQARQYNAAYVIAYLSCSLVPNQVPACACPSRAS